MFNRLLLRFGRFSDGTKLKQVSREEFIYSKPNGYSVKVYVFWVTGHEENVDRVLVLSSLNHWGKPNDNEKIELDEKNEITKKLREYFYAFGETMIVDS